jgi:hypothetical protein
MNHLDSSPTKSYDTIDQFAKGSLVVIYELALLQAQLRGLQTANDILSKRRKARKPRIYKGVSFNI